MGAKRNVRVSVAAVARLRACRAGYRNVREGLGEANRRVRAAFERADALDAEDGTVWQRRWLGRCSFWRARLRRAIRHVEDLLNRPHRL